MQPSFVLFFNPLIQIHSGSELFYPLLHYQLSVISSAYFPDNRRKHEEGKMETEITIFVSFGVIESLLSLSPKEILECDLIYTTDRVENPWNMV